MSWLLAFLGFSLLIVLHEFGHFIAAKWTGMRVERFFCSAPQCVPSRTAFLTGRSPVAVRMGRFNSPLPPEIITLPEVLRPLGYYTGVCGRYFHLNGVIKAGAVTTEPQMSAAEVAELVTAAKSFGKQTFAHASGDKGIENVIEGGADSVEHGFFIRDDQLARMRDRQIAWVPTFAPVQEQVDLVGKQVTMVHSNLTKDLRSGGLRGFTGGLRDVFGSFPEVLQQVPKLDSRAVAGRRALHGGEAPPAGARPALGVRRGALPQHRRMLQRRYGDVHDPRRHLHAGVRVLRCDLR